jgi:hypothetical protein
MVYLFYLQEKSEREKEKKEIYFKESTFSFFIEIKKIYIGDGSEMEKYSFTS